jgi:hypothetical protein
MRKKDKERGDRCTNAQVHKQADMLACIHTHTQTHLIELKPHQGLNQRALPTSLMTHYYDSGCIKWLVKVLKIEEKNKV